MVLDKSFESHLDYREIKPVNAKGNQPWIFIGRTDAEDETPILWPPDAKNQLIGKGPGVGNDWRQEEKRVAEDEIDSITNWADMNLRRLWEVVKDRRVFHATVHVVTMSQTWLSNWKTVVVKLYRNKIWKKCIASYDLFSLSLQRFSTTPLTQWTR